MELRPSVFIGSSSEGLHIAEALQQLLDHEAEVTVWSQGIFDLSQSYLESLLKTLETTDFAILAVTADDMVVSRGTEREAPRDNVLFELGLFKGQLGRNRCFFVFDRTKDLKIPTDLLGLAAATYSPHQSGNLQAALGTTATAIKGKMKRMGARARLLRVGSVEVASSANVPSLEGRWAGYAPEGPNPTEPNSSLEIKQHGTFVRATITRPENGGSRVFEYEGRFTSGQLILFFEDKDGRGYVVGAMVLHLEADLRTLSGRSTYYHHTKHTVVSAASSAW